jgi:uncharacterized protein YyaL (SSP411 family)
VLILRGTPGTMSDWQSALSSRYLPTVLTIVLTEAVTDLPAVLDKPHQDNTTAWLCRGTQCLPPISNLHELLKQLS